MSQLDKQQEQRRKVMTFLAAGAVAVPVLGLSACGGDSSPAGESAATAPAGASDSMTEKAQSTINAAEDSVRKAMDSAEAAVDEAADEATIIAKQSAGGMAQVDESSPQALGLSYRHDATTVDGSVQTRYASGQLCSNCILFQGSNAEWGGCPLFAGQQVKASGWCSAYSAAS